MQHGPLIPPLVHPQIRQRQPPRTKIAIILVRELRLVGMSNAHGKIFVARVPNAQNVGDSHLIRYKWMCRSRQNSIFPITILPPALSKPTLGRSNYDLRKIKEVVICSKCGIFKKSGISSCCAPGGAWFKNCGGAGNNNVDHRWSEGKQTCKCEFQVD